MGKEMKKLPIFPLVVLLLSMFAPMVFAGDLCKFLRFDGTDDYVSVPNDASLNVTGGDFTVEFWARSSGWTWESGEQNTVCYMNADNLGWCIGFTISRTGEVINHIHAVFFGYDHVNWDEFMPEGSTDLNDVEWHHIVGRRNGAVFEVWVDGVLDGTETDATIGNIDSDDILTVGADLVALNWFYGDIDHVRFYSRDILDAEIAYSFANKEPQDETDLELWLKMDDETGDTATDETANNNDGTLSPDYPSNAPEWIDETPSVPAGEAAGDAMEEAGLTMATIMTVFVILWGLSGEGELREVLSYLMAIAVILIIASVVKGIG